MNWNQGEHWFDHVTFFNSFHAALIFCSSFREEPIVCSNFHVGQIFCSSFHGDQIFWSCPVILFFYQQSRNLKRVMRIIQSKFKNLLLRKTPIIIHKICFFFKSKYKPLVPIQTEKVTMMLLLHEWVAPEVRLINFKVIGYLSWNI